MAKGHRDNVAARKKRGPAAYAKRAARRTVLPRCKGCGTPCRAAVLDATHLCPVCIARATAQEPAHV